MCSLPVSRWRTRTCWLSGKIFWDWIWKNKEGDNLHCLQDPELGGARILTSEESLTIMLEKEKRRRKRRKKKGWKGKSGCRKEAKDWWAETENSTMTEKGSWIRKDIGVYDQEKMPRAKWLCLSKRQEFQQWMHLLFRRTSSLMGFCFEIGSSAPMRTAKCGCTKIALQNSAGHACVVFMEQCFGVIFFWCIYFLIVIALLLLWNFVLLLWYQSRYSFVWHWLWFIAK